MKFNKLIPELSVRDIEKSKHFYINILEFKLEYERINDKFAFISFEGSQIMIEQVNNNWNTGNLEYPYGRGINLQIETDDIDKIRGRLQKYGIKPFKETMINRYECKGVIYEEKELLVQDLDGYLLRFAEDEAVNNLGDRNGTNTRKI